MNKIGITIELKSPTLLSNGEPEGLYDESYIQDEFNLPVFPAKRLKGLLRESCLELLEWSNNKTSPIDIINFIFGKSGASNETTASKIQILNGEVVRKNEWVEIASKSKKRFDILAAIDSYFSMKVAQTQIEENGLAKEGSLRQLKLLAPKKEASFETTILLSEDLGSELIELIKMGLINIRRVGTGRNRGWGRVQIKMDEEPSLDKTSWGNITLPSLKRKEVDLDEVEKEEVIKELDISFETIPIKITAQSNLIFPKWDGDENTVSTKDHIPGSMIWGAFAGKFIKIYGKKTRNIMDDAKFQFLFYQGGIQFSPAFPFIDNKVFTYPPKHWVRSKLYPKDPYENMFDKIIPSGKLTIPRKQQVD